MPETENNPDLEPASTTEIRNQIAELQAQPESAEQRVQIAVLNCRLWTAIGHAYQARAEETKDEEQRDRLIELAMRCDQSAANWAHEARQAKRLQKVDLLTEIKQRLDGTDLVIARFHKLADRFDADRQLQAARFDAAAKALEVQRRGVPA